MRFIKATASLDKLMDSESDLKLIENWSDFRVQPLGKKKMKVNFLKINGLKYFHGCLCGTKIMQHMAHVLLGLMNMVFCAHATCIPPREMSLSYFHVGCVLGLSLPL